jgi:hypothetical protein
MNHSKLVAFGALVVFAAGCQLFVDPSQQCELDGGGTPCKSGSVCAEGGVCVESSGSSASTGSSGNSSSGATSGSGSGSSGSSGSSGAIGAGRYGAASFAIPPSQSSTGSTNSGPPTPYYVGGSVGDPQSGAFKGGAFKIVASNGGIEVVDAGVGLSTPRRHAMAAFVGSGVLVVGGESSNGVLATSAEFSATLAGKPLQTFGPYDGGPVTNREAGALVFVPPPPGSASGTTAFVYLVGGIAPGVNAPLPSEVASSSPTRLGSFASVGTPLARAYMGVVQVETSLYAFGGVDVLGDGGTSVAKSVLSAKLIGDGGLGDWTDTGVLTAQPHVEPAVYFDPATGHVVVASGLNDIFGNNHFPQTVPEIEVASFGASLGQFANGGQITGRGGFVGGFWGDAGYAIGGEEVQPGSPSTTDLIETYPEP